MFSVLVAPWVLATLPAALAQTARFALQKRLKSSGLSVGGATFSRFLFAVPIAWALTAILATNALPALSPRFWMFACVGGVAQIAATMATVALFSERHFAVGVAFTKTETLMVAGFSALFLGETVSKGALIAICVGVLGVLLISLKPGARLAFSTRACLLGLTAGALFALAAIGYRGATTSLGEAPALLRASYTLACVTTVQTVLMIPFLRLTDPGEVSRVVGRWRETVFVGVLGMIGSYFWFLAFSLQNAAHVRAFGQLELLFSLLLGWVMFRETSTRREYLGMALLLASILGILYLA
ncbi:MAG: EamA family transporter [Maritimibacter sp.]